MIVSKGKLFFVSLLLDNRNDYTIKMFLNPLKPNLFFILFKNSALSSKRTPRFTITKINWLMLFKEIIAVYTENHRQHKIQNSDLLIKKQVGHIFT
jgi:hypothetical protein